MKVVFKVKSEDLRSLRRMARDKESWGYTKTIWEEFEKEVEYATFVEFEQIECIALNPFELLAVSIECVKYELITLGGADLERIRTEILKAEDFDVLIERLNSLEINCSRAYIPQVDEKGDLQSRFKVFPIKVVALRSEE